jgi:integrase
MMGSFMKDLRQKNGTSAAALEFLILTSVRSRNVRCATWPEIDFESKTWAIPGDNDDDNDDDRQRMEGGIAHRVPLSKQAIELLEGLDRHVGTEFLFPSPRKAGPLSQMAMTKLMRDMEVGAVPHGMRSTFIGASADA